MFVFLLLTLLVFFVILCALFPLHFLSHSFSFAQRERIWVNFTHNIKFGISQWRKCLPLHTKNEHIIPTRLVLFRVRCTQNERNQEEKNSQHIFTKQIQCAVVDQKYAHSWESWESYYNRYAKFATIPFFLWSSQILIFALANNWQQHFQSNNVIFRKQRYFFPLLYRRSSIHYHAISKFGCISLQQISLAFKSLPHLKYYSRYFFNILHVCLVVCVCLVKCNGLYSLSI